MKHLVTGVAGFVGSNLARKFLMARMASMTRHLADSILTW